MKCGENFLTSLCVRVAYNNLYFTFKSAYSHMKRRSSVIYSDSEDDCANMHAPDRPLKRLTAV